MLGLEKVNRYEQYHDFDLLLGGAWEASLTYCGSHRWYATLFFRPTPDDMRQDVLTATGDNPQTVISQLLDEKPQLA